MMATPGDGQARHRVSLVEPVPAGAHRIPSLDVSLRYRCSVPLSTTWARWSSTSRPASGSQSYTTTSTGTPSLSRAGRGTRAVQHLAPNAASSCRPGLSGWANGQPPAPDRCHAGPLASSGQRQGHGQSTMQITPICAATTAASPHPRAAPNGGSARVLPDHLHGSAARACALSPPVGLALFTQEVRIAPERQIHIAPSHGRWSVARAPARQLLSGAWW
jgi:hypothetical protein